MRRALARARDGKALDHDEATVLLHARGGDLRTLLGYAARTRDAGLAAAGRPGVITYSRKVFIPLTRLCRDRCGYCTFATVPQPPADAAVPGARTRSSTSPGGARSSAARKRCSRSGDRPEARWHQAREWLDAHGYDDTLSYVRAMAIRVLEETGLLPHLNPGRDELAGLPAAQAGGAVDGHDAGDHVAPAVHGEGRAALRQPGQGPGGPAARPGGRGPVGRAVHDRHPDRHRRDAGRARRRDLRDPQGRPRVRGHPGSHRAELPGQARHQDARRPRRRARRPGGHHRRHAAGPRPAGADPGTAEPGAATSTS